MPSLNIRVGRATDEGWERTGEHRRPRLDEVFEGSDGMIWRAARGEDFTERHILHRIGERRTSRVAATMQEVLERWITESGRKDPTFLHRSDGSLFVNKEGVLFYDREGRGRWGHGRAARNIPLAQFIGDRYRGGFIYLNGDGLEDDEAMGWQTRVRERCQQQFGWDRCAIIPISALRSAEIIIESIKPIEITQDRNEVVPRWLDSLNWLESGITQPLVWWQEHLPKGTVPRNDTSTYITLEEQFANHQHENWLEFRVEGFRTIIQMLLNTTGNLASVNNVYIWAQPENGQANWQSLRYTPKYPHDEKSSWVWQQNVHRLGAVVFSSNDALSNKRSKWVSAFDTIEPDPLYFLAQLPSVGKIKTYGDAIEALAPPQVHHARNKGIPVFRQGDIFAIETTMTDEQIYDGCISRVRRDVAIQELAGLFHNGRIHALVAPTDEEVSDQVECPLCSGHTLKVGCGELSRKALMIFNTGHTASEVVVKPGGVTFIRGTMFHDPHLETPGRTPDHQRIVLGAGWFVCMRNTVPRQKASGQSAPVPIRLDPFGTGLGRATYLDETLSSRMQAPGGFRWTGEFREPDVGEWWLTWDGQTRERGGRISGGEPNADTHVGRLRHILARAQVRAAA